MKNIIIIGSGIGSLIAGNLIAKKGHKVTIFESHSMPGGYTAGFCRKGYYFESGTVSFEASATVFKAMQDIGVFEKLDFVQHRVRLVSEYYDGTPEQYDDYKTMIYSAFPADKEKLDAFFSDLEKMAGLTGDMDEPMPFLYSGLNMLKAMLPYVLNAPKLMKLSKLYGNMTTSEFAARYFEKDSALFKLFSRIGYPDMSAMFIGAALSGMFTDLWTVKGGMQSWADILAENYRRLGGDLKLNSYVNKIITKNGAAVGVSCNNTVYEADHVIAAGDYKKTILRLLDDKNLIPQTLQDNIGGAAVSEGFFTVYLGLNMSNGELGKYMKVPYVFVFNDKPGYNIYNSEDGEFFSKTSASLYSPSMVNSKHAPEGKSSLMLQTMVPYHWMNNWGGGDRAVYGQLKEKAMDAMINSVTRLIPGLKECIEYKDAATPLTYERFTHNTDGASSSWSWNPKKKFYNNTMSVNIETPVKNLYIGSCWAMQIGGVPGAIAAAYQCAKKIKWERTHL
ncbi:phytoene desaturase family protein [Sporomusa acidovorans]|uniref:4,4'-diapophytoene desaturase (4,4'-diapolycopene-forming) n=1 Tax=Sporomusa acidovorans (strain ATCC 49682 / DSM 3132 / Mol) TaxID=1123286 RepID=A0ABZ3IXD8_SPOA4|nr:NAD(P)/FAD-dependent oxidoreductase [Sporomusa acidovorans]OZC13057.1 dehydrosqualene desaturase [Sporomusa acidovorans DSM 3132]SDF50959.1 Phytoene dehydrogenase-related protein [Sporomusa acidovorans]